MIEQTKAGFRALREECGLTQQDLAEGMSVTVMSVKRWENDNQPGEPPEEAWEWLHELREELYSEARFYARYLTDYAESVGDYSGKMTIAYYRTQEDLNRAREETNFPEYPLGFVNKMSQIVAAFFEGEGFDVKFEYNADRHMYGE